MVLVLERKSVSALRQKDICERKIVDILVSDASFVGSAGAKLDGSGDGHGNDAGGEAGAKGRYLHTSKIFVALKGGVEVTNELQKHSLVDAGLFKTRGVGSHETTVLGAGTLLGNHNRQSQRPGRLGLLRLLVDAGGHFSHGRLVVL